MVITSRPGFVIASKTDIGAEKAQRGRVNEDSLEVRIPPDAKQLATWGKLLVIADGMGGHASGAVASDMAVREVTRAYYYGSPDLPPGEALKQAIIAANAEIYRLAAQRPEWQGMGTTIVAAVVRGENELYLANVGDSRAYLVRGGRIQQLTNDHSWAAEQVRLKLLTPEQARNHPEGHKILRSLGYRPQVEVETYGPYQLQPDDVLILCSDGLSDMVPDEQIQNTVLQYPPQEAVERLVELANKAGGRDNISVIVMGPSRVVTESAGSAAGEETQPLASITPLPTAQMPSPPVAGPPSRKRRISLPKQLPKVTVIGGVAVLVVLAALLGFFVVGSWLVGDKKAAAPTRPPSHTAIIQVAISATPTQTRPAATYAAGTVIPTTSALGGLPTSTLAPPTDTPVRSPAATLFAPPTATGTATISGRTEVTITGLDNANLKCLTLLFYRGNQEIHKGKVEKSPYIAPVAAERVKIIGSEDGTCPWNHCKLVEPASGDELAVVNGRAEFKFEPKAPPTNTPPPSPTYTPLPRPVPVTETPAPRTQGCRSH